MVSFPFRSVQAPVSTTLTLVYKTACGITVKNPTFLYRKIVLVFVSISKITLSWKVLLKPLMHWI